VRRLSLSRANNMPTLKAKAFNSIIICEWLAVCTQAVSRQWPENSYFRDRASMRWGLSEVFNVLRRADHWMSEADLKDLEFARDTSLRMFMKLSAMAQSATRHCTPPARSLTYSTKRATTRRLQARTQPAVGISKMRTT
jgi:hypothetical protein